VFLVETGCREIGTVHFGHLNQVMLSTRSQLSETTYPHDNEISQEFFGKLIKAWLRTNQCHVVYRMKIGVAMLGMR
jgi:hypothetical protein